MPESRDGPTISQFKPLTLRGNVSLNGMAKAGVSKEMSEAVGKAPSGNCVGWGIPFKIGKVVVVKDNPISVKVGQVRAQWLVFVHTSDIIPLKANRQGFFPVNRGPGRLGEHAADYVVVYDDGSEKRIPIRRRHQLGAFRRPWGENCTEAVVHTKQHSVPAHHEQMQRSWGRSQTRASSGNPGPWTNWLFAWKNPKPAKRILAIRFEPVSGVVVVSAVSYGNASSMPFRWNSRQKAVLRLPKNTAFASEAAPIALDDDLTRTKPLVLERSMSKGEQFAGHRSHSSHRSHRSHYSSRR